MHQQNQHLQENLESKEQMIEHLKHEVSHNLCCWKTYDQQIQVQVVLPLTVRLAYTEVMLFLTGMAVMSSNLPIFTEVWCLAGHAKRPGNECPDSCSQ